MPGDGGDVRHRGNLLDQKVNLQVMVMTRATITAMVTEDALVDRAADLTEILADREDRVDIAFQAEVEDLERQGYLVAMVDPVVLEVLVALEEVPLEEVVAAAVEAEAVDRPLLLNLT